MAFATAEHWEERFQESNGEHIDWLCHYATIRKVVLHYLRQWKRPLPAILLLGTGLSTFAEELYDGGYSPITVLDFSPTVANEHRQRAATPPRGGVTVAQRDVTDSEWPEVDEDGMRFGIVVDKGLIDCLLTCRDGIDRATAAITNVWNRMTTPGIWISVSHSPPADRRDLYRLTGAATAGASNVYWHDIQVKRVVLPPLEYSSKTAVPGPEKLEDYVEAAAGVAGVAAGKEGAEGSEGGEGERPLPGGDVFRDDVAYIYILTK